MKQTKIRLALIMGGKSAEHEVSLQSAKNVFEALDKERYEVLLIGIDKAGAWHHLDPEGYLIHENDPRRIALRLTSRLIGISPATPEEPFFELDSHRSLGRIDVIFPILHGPLGEDGTIQGLFKLLDRPFVGAGVIGSAIGMDKDVMKRLLHQAGLPTARFRVYHRNMTIDPDDIKRDMGFPVFVKPANLGSSVGIHKVKQREQLQAAAEDAFRFDHKIIIEEYIEGREIECSVLGNEDPVASFPGEIRPGHEFYSYEAKYIDDQGAELIMPAPLDNATVKQVQDLAVRAYRVLCCEGMARVDFFLKRSGEVLINEINTIPGFTRISMYPKLWEISGLPYPKLINRLVELALERHRREKALQTSFSAD